MKGILGKKVGMTQVFTKAGKLIPVTVIEVEPNVVTQIKTFEKDGYDAIQLATATVKEKSSNKAKMGHTNKANTTPKRFLRELRGVNVNDYTLGQTINIDVFKEGEIVDLASEIVDNPQKLSIAFSLLLKSSAFFIEFMLTVSAIFPFSNIMLKYFDIIFASDKG